MTGRKLRLVLFIALAIVQLAVAGRAIVTSELTLRSGETYRFRIQPVDPVDAFRGRYVAIRMAEARAPVAGDFEVDSGQWIYVSLEVDDEGMASFGRATLEPPDGKAFLKLRGGSVLEEEDGHHAHRPRNGGNGTGGGAHPP